MSQGLQCWDASGRLVVDLTDYSIRYIGRLTVSFTAGETSKNVPFTGATQDGTVIAIVSTWVGVNEYYCRAYDGGFTIYYLPVNGSNAVSLNLEVYNFQ